ncbi:hypothetical protein J6590_061333 [Homalodisca vitripennis]|nr:hypothetical protein J6590_061333 [Homalodisca vitripennis]
MEERIVIVRRLRGLANFFNAQLAASPAASKSAIPPHITHLRRVPAAATKTGRPWYTRIQTSCSRFIYQVSGNVNYYITSHYRYIHSSVPWPGRCSRLVAPVNN